MDRISIETRVLVVKNFYQSNESDGETMQRLHILLEWDAASSVSLTRRLIKILKKLVQLLFSKASVRLRRLHETTQKKLRGSYC